MIKHHKDLEIYKVAFGTAMKIFELSKEFPREERYSLTDRIRRSSRSVCANLAEAWRKRRYEAAFRAKLSDSEAALKDISIPLVPKGIHFNNGIASHDAKRKSAVLGGAFKHLN